MSIYSLVYLSDTGSSTDWDIVTIDDRVVGSITKTAPKEYVARYDGKTVVRTTLAAALHAVRR